MKATDYDQLLAQASESTRRLNQAVVAGPCPAEPEPGALPPLAGGAEIQTGGPRRARVRITVCTTRLRDPDNTVCKWLVDGLRYAGLIRNDTEQDIHLEIAQRKVKTKQEQGTLIEVIK